MKILMIWEMDSDLVHLHHLRMVADSLRRSVQGVHITLAVSQPYPAGAVSWADTVFATSGVKLKHEVRNPGVLGHLANLGWVGVEMRQTVFRQWASLLRTVKPDLVVCESAPGALLATTLHEIPCISSSNGYGQVACNDMGANEDYPEFQDWLWRITGLSYAQLLARPGLVFCPRSVDVERPGLVVHVNPCQWPWEPHPEIASGVILTTHTEDEELLGAIKASGCRRNQLAPFAAIRNSQVRLVVGNYDPYSFSMAASMGCAYLGARNPHSRDKEVSERIAGAKRTITQEELTLASSFLGELALVNPPESFCDLDLAIQLTTRSIAGR